MTFYVHNFPSLQTKTYQHRVVLTSNGYLCMVKVCFQQINTDKLERERRLELPTCTLARYRSTN